MLVDFLNAGWLGHPNVNISFSWEAMDSTEGWDLPVASYIKPQSFEKLYSKVVNGQVLQKCCISAIAQINWVTLIVIWKDSK